MRWQDGSLLYIVKAITGLAIRVLLMLKHHEKHNHLMKVSKALPDLLLLQQAGPDAYLSV